MKQDDKFQRTYDAGKRHWSRVNAGVDPKRDDEDLETDGDGTDEDAGKLDCPEEDDKKKKTDEAARKRLAGAVMDTFGREAGKAFEKGAARFGRIAKKR